MLVCEICQKGYVNHVFWLIALTRTDFKNKTIKTLSKNQVRYSCTHRSWISLFLLLPVLFAVLENGRTQIQITVMDPNPATQFEISNPTDMQDDAVQLCCHDDMMFRASSLVLIEYVYQIKMEWG